MRIFMPVLLLFLQLCLTGGGAAADNGKPVIHFGVIPRYNPMVMYRNYQPLMDYLTEQTSYRFELRLARDYPQAVEHLRAGVTQIASLGDVTFFEASRSFGAVPLVSPLNSKGEPFYRSIIIVRKGGGIENLNDLKGKRFAFGSSHSTSGNLIPRLYLSNRDITLFDFADYQNLDSHDSVAKAVLKGKVDAGAVKDVVAERYRDYGLEFLAHSDPIPSVPIVVRPEVDPLLLAEVRNALLAIDPADPVMQQRMQTWDPEFRYGFTKVNQQVYQPIFNMIDSIAEGCGIKCH
jgi:phosphonate transport system substrate-binding protein